MKRSLALLCALLSGCGAGNSTAPSRDAASTQWTGIWGTALHQPAAVAADTTLRLIVHPTLGGEVIRLRLANPYGDAPVRLQSIHLALRTQGAAIDAATLVPVSFDGLGNALTLDPGEEAVSDPLRFTVTPGDDLAISFHLPDGGTLSQHGSATGISYLATGDHASDADAVSYTSTATSWWGLAGIDAERPDSPGTLVALGDSITDGNNPPEIDNRWPDYFALRLQEAAIPIGVLNAGIGANQVTQDTNFLGSSEAAVKRFERDVLQRPGVRWMVLFEGTNDLAQGIAGDAVFAGLLDIASRARQRGVIVIAGTVTPRGKDPFWAATPAFEVERVRLNELIRANIGPGKAFDHLADFDAALGSPLEPSVMAPEYDSGDGLHPSPLGLMAIAGAVPLDALK